MKFLFNTQPGDGAGNLHIFFGDDIERLREWNHLAMGAWSGVRHGAQRNGGKLIQPVVKHDVDGAIDQGQFTVAERTVADQSDLLLDKKLSKNPSIKIMMIIIKSKFHHCW